MSDKCADSAPSVRAQHHQVVTALQAKYPDAVAHLANAREDILALTMFAARPGARYGATTPRSA